MGQLEKEKEKLYSLIIRWGIGDEKVLKQSQKVDKLIISVYEKNKRKPITKPRAGE